MIIRITGLGLIALAALTPAGAQDVPKSAAGATSVRQVVEPGAQPCPGSNAALLDDTVKPAAAGSGKVSMQDMHRQAAPAPAGKVAMQDMHRQAAPAAPAATGKVNVQDLTLTRRVSAPAGTETLPKATPTISGKAVMDANACVQAKP